MYICIYVCMYVWMDECMHACMHCIALYWITLHCIAWHACIGRYIHMIHTWIGNMLAETREESKPAKDGSFGGYQCCLQLECFKTHTEVMVLWSPRFSLSMICWLHHTVTLAGMPVLQCAFKAKTNGICPKCQLGIAWMLPTPGTAIEYWQIVLLDGWFPL